MKTWRDTPSAMLAELEQRFRQIVSD